MFDDDQAIRCSRRAPHPDVACPPSWGYDPNDPLIPAVANRWALTYLRTHANLQERSYPSMGHSVSLDEIADLAGFLQHHLPDGRR